MLKGKRVGSYRLQLQLYSEGYVEAVCSVLVSRCFKLYNSKKVAKIIIHRLQ